MKKLTNKQMERIAKIWAGSILSSFVIDEFSDFEETDYSEEQTQAMGEIVNRIGRNILKNEPAFLSLPEVFKHVLNKK